MDTILLIISSICFISAYGTHMFAKNNCGDWCGYMAVPWMTAIPWISGFILAVIPEAILFNIFWLWAFLLNIVLVFIIGPFVTKFLLRRVASGKGAGFDILVLIALGIISLIIGLILK